MKTRNLLFITIGLLFNLNIFAQDYSMSNQVATTCTGNLSDSGILKNYSDNEDYTFVISPEGAYGLTLTFSSWEVEENYDFLYIYDGTDINAPLLGRFSVDAPPTITATGNSLTLYFVSDGSINQAGWTANWTSFGRGCADDTPGSTTYITECQGTLYDLGGATSNYGDNQDYTVVINPGTFDIMMNFKTWDLEAGYDYLHIYDGENKDAPLIGSYSATSPGSITAHSGKITLHFVSDEYVNGAGWAATWEGLGGTCSGMIAPPTNPTYSMGNFRATECTGNFNDSGNLDDSYSNDEDYTFVIAPEGAYDLTLTFDTWEVEAGYDFLYIYDGADVSAPLLGTYSRTIPSTITSTSGQLTLRFISDGSIKLGGWSASWTSFGRGCLGTPNSRLVENEEILNTPIKVFPNPVATTLNIEIATSSDEKVNFQITDLSGKVVLNQNHQIDGSRILSFDVQDLEAGAYIFRMNSASIHRAQKIIKAK